MTQSAAGRISVADASALAREVLDEVEKAVVGKRLPLHPVCLEIHVVSCPLL